MQFSIQKKAFVKYLSNVQRAISSRVTLDILEGIKLDLFEDSLTLTGSNADISIETVISIADQDADLQIEKTGSIVLKARIFNDIIKKLPEANIFIETNEKMQAKISAGSVEFTINGLDSNDYPRLPEIGSKNQLLVPSDILKQVIDQTKTAASTQESRPLLTGIHIVIKNNELLAVATDSHRLSQRKLKINSGNEEYNIIVPRKSLEELAGLLSDAREDIELQISENQILFIVGHTSFYSRLLEGIYPDTERLIPKTSDTRVEFNSNELLQAIERAALLSHVGRNNVVKLSLDGLNQKVTLYSNSPEIGNVEENIAFESLNGKGLEISFNPDYMRDALKSFGHTSVIISFTVPLRPFILVPSEDQENFIQLITPVRTM